MIAMSEKTKMHKLLSAKGDNFAIPKHRTSENWDGSSSKPYIFVTLQCAARMNRPDHRAARTPASTQNFFRWPNCVVIFSVLHNASSRFSSQNKCSVAIFSVLHDPLSRFSSQNRALQPSISFDIL